jgi:pimeloyl-[acyl-carrier protein] methyl ester esterase
VKAENYKLPDGRDLSWYDTGRGRPLVLLHGWAMSAAAFAELAAMLADDFRLLIPDLPGHGNSSPAAQNDLGGIANDLNCWLAAISSTPVALGGWSLGGMLALEMARQKPLTIDRLLLIGTTPRFTSAGDWSLGLPVVQVRALARNLERSFETTLSDFFKLAFAGEDISWERLRAIRNFAVKHSPLPDQVAALGLLHELAIQNQLELVAQINQPTLVMHGELDQIAPLAAGRYLADLLPHGDFLEFPGVGHGPFLSRPQEVADKIMEFC